jgi:hypothetical protein
MASATVSVEVPPPSAQMGIDLTGSVPLGSGTGWVESAHWQQSILPRVC